MVASPSSPVPEVHACHVRRLVSVLRESGEWMTRKQLAAIMGDQSAAWERKVRAIASVAAPVVVSFPGSPGYRHIGACTDEEVEHCINAFRSSAQDQMRRSNLYQHALNERRLRRTEKPVQEMLPLE
jgi:hypothetical protein